MKPNLIKQKLKPDVEATIIKQVPVSKIIIPNPNGAVVKKLRKASHVKHNSIDRTHVAKKDALPK